MPVRLWLGAPNIMKIASRRKNIEHQIKYWTHRLQDLQDECKHLNFAVIACSDNNKQWEQFSCSECGKIWTEYK